MFTVFNFSFNYLDIAIVLVFVLAVVIGYIKGFFSTIVNFIRNSIGLFLCFYFSRNLTPIVYENYFKQRALQKITEEINATGIESFTGQLETSLSKLPSFITSCVDMSLLSVKSENVADVILINIVEPVLLTVVKILIFAIVFIVFFLSTGIIIHLAKRTAKRREDKRGHKSTLKKADKLVGCIIALLTSIVIVFAIVSVAGFVIGLDDKASFANSLFESSALVKFMQTINPFNAITEGVI